MKKIGLLIIVIMLFSSSGCDLSKSRSEEWPPSFEVKLVNDDSEDVHMWITGSEISPFNKVYPGESRTAIYLKSPDLVADKINHDVLTIFAGRNGAILDSKEYRIGVTYEGPLEVTFNGKKLK